MSLNLVVIECFGIDFVIVKSWKLKSRLLPHRNFCFPADINDIKILSKKESEEYKSASNIFFLTKSDGSQTPLTKKNLSLNGSGERFCVVDIADSGFYSGSIGRGARDDFFGG